MMQRPNLAEDIATILRDRIVGGDLQAGERINEVHLARELGISRTPLREALTRLVGEGALEVFPRKGFFVRPLSVQELEDIYPIRAILDVEALALVEMPFSAVRLERLVEINHQLADAQDVRTVIDLDDEWHRELLADCPNQVLLELIEDFMRRTRRYEQAYLREQKHVSVALEEHEAILEALRQDHLERACAALRQNLQSGLDPIRSWLRSFLTQDER